MIINDKISFYFYFNFYNLINYFKLFNIIKILEHEGSRRMKTELLLQVYNLL
jgi:hypothetical protein